uniref:nicotinamidase n=1 Tax=Acrobeloides nanus TaxID=290746 RepID=A0A914CTY3_9BILA
MLSRNQCPYDDCGLYYANMYDLIYHIEDTHIPEIEKSEVEKLEHESNGSIADSQKEGSENNTPTIITQESPMKAPSSAPIPLSLLCRLQPYPKSKVVTPIKPLQRVVSFNYYRKREVSPLQTPRAISPKRPAIRAISRPDELGHIIHSPSEIPEDHRKFRCTYEGCKKGYKNLQGLKNHMRTSHQAQNVGLSASEEGILSRIPLPDPASLAASPIRVTKYQCQHCPKSYKTMANLHKHVQETHPRFAPTTNLQTPLITMSPIRPQSPMTQNTSITETLTPQMTIVTKQLPHGISQSPSRLSASHLAPAGTNTQFQQQSTRAASPMQPTTQQQYQQAIQPQQILQTPQHPPPTTPSRTYQASTQQQQQYQTTTAQYAPQQAYSQSQQQQTAATYSQVQNYPQQTYAVQAPQQSVQYSQTPAASTQQQQQQPQPVQTYVAQQRQQPSFVHQRVQQIQHQEPIQQQQQHPAATQQAQPISITQMRQSPQHQRQFVAGTGTTSVRVTTLSPFSAQQQQASSGGTIHQQAPTIAQQLQAAQIQQQQQPQAQQQQPQTMAYQYQQTPSNVPRGTTQMHVRYSTQAVSQASAAQQTQQYTTGPATHTIQIASAGTTGSTTPNTYTHTQFVRSAATGGAIQLQTVSASGTSQQAQGQTAQGQPQMRMIPAGTGGNYRRVGAAHLTGYQLQPAQQVHQGQGVPRGAHQATRFYASNAAYQQPQRSVRLTSISALQQQQSTQPPAQQDLVRVPPCLLLFALFQYAHVFEMAHRIPHQLPGLTFSAFCEFISGLIIDSGAISEEKDVRQLFEYFDVDRDGELSESETGALNTVLIDRLNSLKSALIVVDFQNDFVTGSLAIKKGRARQDPREALMPLNRLLSKNGFDLVVYTLDWHPSNHISFHEHCRNADRKLRKEDKARKLRPLDTVTFDEPCCTQTLYPAHCVQNSWGADLCPELVRVPNARFVKKGMNVFVDSYSAFYDNNYENKTELEDLLRSEKIDILFICGLAYEICVAYTTRDASKLNFYSALVKECSKGLNLDVIKAVNEEFQESNIPIIDSHAVGAFLDYRKVPYKWLWKLVGLPIPKASFIEKQNHVVQNENFKHNNNNKLIEMSRELNGSLIQHELTRLNGQISCEASMNVKQQIEA